MPFYMLSVCITLTPKFYGRKWHCLKGGSNNSEIGIWHYQKCFFESLRGNIAGCVTEQTFKKTLLRVCKSHFRIAEIKKQNS